MLTLSWVCLFTFCFNVQTSLTFFLRKRDLISRYLKILRMEKLPKNTPSKVQRKKCTLWKDSRQLTICQQSPTLSRDVIFNTSTQLFHFGLLYFLSPGMQHYQQSKQKLLLFYFNTCLLFTQSHIENVSPILS